jgi:uncharacterized membrane protein YhaH (DUF805 family)
MGPMSAMLKKYLGLSGRSGRKSLWLFVSLGALAGFVALIVSGLLMDAFGDWGIVPFILFLVLAAAGLLALSVRRLHDAGWSAWWTLVYLIPVAGLLLVVPLLVKRGELGANAYGDDPVLIVLSPEARTRRAALDADLEAAAMSAQQLRVVQQRSAEAERRSQAARLSLEGARSRLADLESGRGSKLATACDATLYDFWLTLPTYSGPVHGATARVTASGDVHSVSEVAGKTKGGLGGAVVGGLIAGPVGAIVGSNVARQTTVQTTVRTVDTREYELEISGPGFAYSARRSSEDGLRAFRDLLNARGSSSETADDLIPPQRASVGSLDLDAQRAVAEVTHAAAALATAQLSCEQAWGKAGGDCISVSDKARVRWARMGSPTSNSLGAGARAERSAAGRVESGWHADPSRRHQFRFWDGAEWSSSVSDDGQVTSDPL